MALVVGSFSSMLFGLANVHVILLAFLCRFNFPVLDLAGKLHAAPQRKQEQAPSLRIHCVWLPLFKTRGNGTGWGGSIGWRAVANQVCGAGPLD